MSEHTAEKDAPGRRGCVVPKRHPGDAAVCATSCWQERIGKGHCPAEPLPTAEKDVPEWVERAVTLRDHFDDWTTMRVAEPQPQYGLVQLNVERKGVLISVDVKRADLLAALAACVPPPAE